MAKKRKVGRPRSENPSKVALYHRKWRKKQGITFSDDFWERVIKGFEKFLEPPFNKGG